MRHFGLIGYPLGHSFSRTYFADKFAREGITDSTYENFPLQDIGELPALLQKDIRGLNVTIPYKKQVIPFLHEATDAVNEMGACNCIDIRNGRLKGYNTDVVGFRDSLRPFLRDYHKKALVLGTGGASAAVAYVFKQLGISFLYVSRNETEGVAGYASLTPELMAEYLLVINTTPLGMYPDVDSCPDIPFHLLTAQHHLFDLVYNPAETRFMREGRKRGATVQNGLQMLELQAEESWRIWNS